MRQLLFDTNIALDVLLDRLPWVVDASDLLQRREGGEIEAHIAAVSVTNVFYVVRRIAGIDSARESVRRCLDLFTIALVDGRVLQDADAMPGADYEDNVQIACAAAAGLDAIVTRDPAGFAGAPLPVWTPAEALRQLTA